MRTAEAYQLQAQLLRVLAHPIRLQILSILARQEACVCHLEAALKRPQPYVSKQLAALRDSGLVTDRRDGTLIYYRVADDHLASWLGVGRALLRDNAGNPVPAPSWLEDILDDCPCPRCQHQSGPVGVNMPSGA